MVKKQSKGPKKAPVAKKQNVIPPKSWTGYPPKTTCSCPATLLGKTAGGGKSAA